MLPLHNIFAILFIAFQSMKPYLSHTSNNIHSSLALFNELYQTNIVPQLLSASAHINLPRRTRPEEETLRCTNEGTIVRREKRGKYKKLHSS